MRPARCNCVATTLRYPADAPRIGEQQNKIRVQTQCEGYCLGVIPVIGDESVSLDLDEENDPVRLTQVPARLRDA